MLLLTQDAEDTEIILTLAEKQTLSEPYFLFVFTHIETNLIVKLIKSTGEDSSDYPYRFNSFLLDPSLFLKTGFWEYKVYEQASSTNEIESSATTLLEQGKMKLLPATPFSVTQYQSPTSYKTYAG